VGRDANLHVCRRDLAALNVATDVLATVVQQIDTHPVVLEVAIVTIIIAIAILRRRLGSVLGLIGFGVLLLTAFASTLASLPALFGALFDRSRISVVWKASLEFVERVQPQLLVIKRDNARHRKPKQYVLVDELRDDLLNAVLR